MQTENPPREILATLEGYVHLTNHDSSVVADQYFVVGNHDLDEEIPDLLVKSFDECSGKTKPSGDGVTMAITYSEYVHEDFPTLASRATQIFLCPPYVKELSREKYMFSTEELLKKIDKFEGDPPEQSGRRLSRKEKLKGVFKKITSSRSEEPEIMEYQAVHRILLHEVCIPSPSP